MGLQVLWFIVIAFFWTGFFILEGFDLGVGTLHMVVGKTDLERRVAINSIGPFWDGNEVWLIVAGAGMFAAFPLWYASMFSALYLAVMLVILALIIRGVSFEYRGKSNSPTVAGDLGLDPDHREPPLAGAARALPLATSCRGCPSTATAISRGSFGTCSRVTVSGSGSRCCRCRWRTALPTSL